MRLTNILLRHNKYRLFQYFWNKKSQVEVIDLGIPTELIEDKVQICDAREYIKQPEPEEFEFPEPYKKIINDPIPGHSDWKEQKIYLFNRRTRLTEGNNQFMALTKTVPYQGFPSSIQCLVGKEQLPNQDILVQNCVNQAMVWDGTQNKLPKIIDIKKPGWVFPRAYGIPHKRKVISLLKKLNILCELGCSKYPETLNRAKLIDGFTKVFVDKGKDTLLFEMESDILITSNKPLKAFATPSEVKITEMEEVPSVYPIKPTLDMIQSNVYTEDEVFPISSNCFKSHIHTLHIAHKSIGYWFPYQKMARGMGCCFSYAAAEAHKRFGPTVKELPEPICVQCVYMDTQSFGFLAYQLNTLDLSTEEGIKNQVWIEEPVDLYEEWNEDTGFQNYNPEVFPKMLALYMNGLVSHNA